MKEIAYLEKTTGGSNKFYRITADVTELTVTREYGRIGTEGRTMIQHLRDEDSVREFFNVKLETRLTRGYVLLAKGGTSSEIPPMNLFGDDKRRVATDYDFGLDLLLMESVSGKRA